MRVRDLREDSDLTQQAIADYLHIRQNTYSQYENGRRQIPLNMLILLARYYNVSTDYILELTDIKAPYPRGRRGVG
ncbi:MAG: helix-turn-helix transcriptional regulator [Clostridia bacterium]|nr:helix-turn-helix transcriptional regulator [Clostridia bacterium]